MSAQTDPSPAPRGRLARERVLLAAVDLADKGGVEAMSLYNHVANKDDILDGMIDLVFGEIGLPPQRANWKTAMR